MTHHAPLIERRSQLICIMFNMAMIFQNNLAADIENVDTVLYTFERVN